MPLSNIKIIATDIDKQVLAKAKEGLYNVKSLKTLPDDLKKKFITQVNEYTYKVADEVKILSMLFFAFHPIMAMYSIYLTKDVLFGCIMTILIMKLYDLVESKGVILENWQQCIQIAILFLLSSMLRNNGFYILMCVIVICFTVIMCFALAKMGGK